MYKSTKIATCCYCGNRATLVLTADRHELSCSACGAPLHDLKKLPSEQVGKPKSYKSSPNARSAYADRRAPPKPKKKKTSKKGFAHRFMDEAFDLIEDIFD